MYVCLLWLSGRLAWLSVVAYGWHHGWSSTTFMPINTRISQVERFLKTSQFTINTNGKEKKKRKCFAMLEVVFWKATWGWECRCVFVAQDNHCRVATAATGIRGRLRAARSRGRTPYPALALLCSPSLPSQETSLVTEIQKEDDISLDIPLRPGNAFVSKIKCCKIKLFYI